MREILFAALLLGCIVADIKSQQGGFEFYDNHGRCWRCLPGSSCIRCPDTLNRGVPDSWNRVCEAPTPGTCSQWPSSSFPHQDIRFFYQCGEDGSYVLVRCPCDHVFDMRQQSCVVTYELTTIACNEYANTDPDPCNEQGDAPPNLTPPVTLPPTGEVTTTPAPTPPGDTTTTTTVNGETTTTANGGGDDGGGGDDEETTRGPPCVCVVWWPCWCNPCWNMPCHSCNGCVGMMG